MVGGSSTKASLGGVTGATFEVTQEGPILGTFVAVQFAGKAGGTTPSKFSFNNTFPHGVPVGVPMAVAVLVAVAVAVAFGVGVGPHGPFALNTNESIPI